MTSLLPIALGLMLQSTALLLLGLVALSLARHRGPALQSLVGRATLAGVGLALLVAAPLAGHIRPLWHVTMPVSPPAPNSGGAGEEPTPLQVWSEEPTPLQAASPPQRGREGVSDEAKGATPGMSARWGKDVASSAPTAGPLISSPSRSGRVAAPGGGVGSYSLMADVWCIGTAILLLWLGICQWHLTRLRRCACPVTSGPASETLAALTPRPPALRTHPSVRSPFLAGLRHPAIFLPTTYNADFDPTALRAILAHELAHLARRDTAWTLAACLLCAALWPQPLLWVLCRRLEQISEEACDQAVLAQDCPPRAYADCLLTLAERHPLGRRERALSAGVAPFRSSLGRRIGHILDKGTHAMSTVTPRLRFAVAALAVAAALGGAFLVSSAPAQSPVPVTVIPTTEQQRFDAMRMQDMANLKAIGIALTQCVQDHDEYLPNAAHWMDALSPYLKDKSVFFDPFQPGAKRYGYAFNRNCSGKSLAAFAHPWETIAVSDSTLGTQNASDTGQSLRVSGTGGMSGSNYLFVDGHVRWSHASSQPSFAVKWDPRWHDTPPPGHYSRNNSIHLSQPTLTRILAWRSPGSSPVVQNDALGQARFLAGLTPVQGPGVVVTLTDSKKRLPQNMPLGMTPPNIIHDSDINQVVNELKAAGAEAIAVNDQRLVATSSVRTAGPTLLINFVPTAPPFVIQAIGDPKTLAAAMNLPGGMASQLKSYDPAMFSVREAGTLTLPAYFGGNEPRYAKPVIGVSVKQAQNQAVIAFLGNQIVDVTSQLRSAERALRNYRTTRHSQTPQTQRKLADMTRRYSSLKDLDMTLQKKRQDMELQMQLDRGY